MRAISIAVLLAVLAVPALAQSGYGTLPPPTPQPTPMAMQGTIVSVAGDVMTVKGSDGTTVPVQLAAQAGVSAHSKRSLGDIKPGDFVGSAAVPGADGKLVAQEVHIFPESLRGTYEGHHPMPGGAADRTMTNAAVQGAAAGTTGTTLTLKYPAGEQTIVVKPDVPVFAIVPGDKSWLKPGLAVSFFGQKAPDGTITAFGVFVERDGQKPMM
jgi:hypothetical protein